MNYNLIMVCSSVLLMVSCAESRDCQNSDEISVTPNLTKAKHEKLDSINVIVIPSLIKNKELSKPDVNAPKTKKGAN